MWVLTYAKQHRLRGVYLSGHSAGSHLLAMMFSSAWFQSLSPGDRQLFAGVVHLSGVFDLTQILQTSVNTPEMNLNNDNVNSLSPLDQNNVDRVVSAASHVKHLIVYGEHDSPVFKQQARQYHDKLKKNGVKNIKLVEVKKADHFNLVEDLRLNDYTLSKEIIKFME